MWGAMGRHEKAIDEGEKSEWGGEKEGGGGGGEGGQGPQWPEGPPKCETDPPEGRPPTQPPPNKGPLTPIPIQSEEPP